MIDNSPLPYPGNVVYVTPISGVDAAHCPNYLHRQSIGLGASQIAIGCLCIAFNAVCFGIGSVFLDLTIISYGIWCGIIFIVSGAFGIAAGKTKSKCQIITYMVLCIVSACFTPALLVCGIWGSVINGRALEECKNGYTRYYYYYYRPPCAIATTLAVFEAALAAYGLIGAILLIWGSTLACKAKVCTCCCQNTYEEQVMMAPINNSAPNNFQGLQGLQVANYSSNTMPYQHGMVVVTGHQPYLPNMDPTTDAVSEEEVVTDGAQVQYNSYSPCKY